MSRMQHVPELKRIWNPPNPFVSEHRELLEQAPVAEMEVYEDASRSVVSHNDSPDIGFRWSVNPYRGCFHACAYCYARPSHEYLGLGAGTDFERKIFIKRRAPELLEAALRKKSWCGETIVFSGVTDCYQPLEAAYQLTRKCLEVCLAYRNPVGVITKSALIRRDADLLAALAREAHATAFISIPFWDEEAARAVEPGTPTLRKRFETVEILAKAGVPTGVSLSPIIPGLNDSDVPAILKESKARGAKYAFYSLVRLSGSVQEVFFHRVRQALPLRAAKIEHQIRLSRGGKLTDSRFGRRHVGQGKYWELLEQNWNIWIKKLGFNEDESDRPATFRRLDQPIYSRSIKTDSSGNSPVGVSENANAEVEAAPPAAPDSSLQLEFPW